MSVLYCICAVILVFLFRLVCLWVHASVGIIPWHGPDPVPSPERRPLGLFLQSSAPVPPPLGIAGSGGRCGPASSCGPPPTPLALRTAYLPGPVAWWSPHCRQGNRKGWRKLEKNAKRLDLGLLRWGVWLEKRNYHASHACTSYQPKLLLTGTTCVN